ncbi:MAG: folylpolyglutamate synthase/dihydrofolate synthase family protein [Trueperaceae bacterium]
MSTAEDAWAWVERRQRFGVRPGLERIRALLDALDRPQDALAVALVAGTNGKGSTTALLDAMLRADPHGTNPVGRFVSPHLVRFDERVHVDGAPVARAELEAVLELIRPHAEAQGATFFEVLVAVALLAFARAGVHRAVLEVGMGGRWDATNATEPELSLVAQVALDHEAVLGGTIEAIAREKAGVWRRGRPALTAADGAALDVLRAAAAAGGARFTSLDDLEWRGVDLGWAGVRVEGLGAGPIATPLLGLHQARNLALAALGAAAWGVPWTAVAQGAADARWPGRLEALGAFGRRWLLDGAHNPAGAAALAAALRSLDARPAVAVVGVSDDKAEGPLASALAALAPDVVATRATASPRAAAVDVVAAALRRSPAAPRVHVAADPDAAVARAIELAPEGSTVVVAGSLYLVGAVRPRLTGEAVEAFERWQ